MAGPNLRAMRKHAAGGGGRSRIAFVAVTSGLAAIGLTGTATANATPPGFPDITGFTQVDPAQFARPLTRSQRWESGYFFFRTPDGISCAIGPTSWCVGALPGLTARQQSACSSVHQGESPTEPFAYGQSDQACVPTDDPILTPGHKLTIDAYEITCAVGTGSTTACINTATNHGFVLRPSGSWTF